MVELSPISHSAHVLLLPYFITMILPDLPFPTVAKMDLAWFRIFGKAWISNSIRNPLAYRLRSSSIVDLPWWRRPYLGSFQRFHLRLTTPLFNDFAICLLSQVSHMRGWIFRQHWYHGRFGFYIAWVCVSLFAKRILHRYLFSWGWCEGSEQLDAFISTCLKSIWVMN